MNRYSSQQRDRGPARLTHETVRVPLSALFLAWVGRRILAVLLWFSRRPVRLAFLVVAYAVVVLFRAAGPVGLLGLTTAGTLGILAWHRFAPHSFEGAVGRRARSLWRGQRIYRYLWQPAMVTTGLAVSRDGEEHLPVVRSVRCVGGVDRVRVRMLPGQVLEDWSKNSARLAQTFGASWCRVHSTDRAQELELWFLTSDPLTEVVPRFPAEDPADPGGLPVARVEDGSTYRLRLLGTHLLVVGATGSGKGSVLWSVLAALGPAIRDGLAQVWALDPKGGMELAPGRRLFGRFVYGDSTPTSAYETAFAEVLEDAVVVMRRRQDTLRGVTRLHTPTAEEPLVVVVVDEIASLTAYVQDRDAKRRIGAALALLLSQGRAVGVLVVGAVQDPRKEILTLRDLFPTRVALRLTEADHVGLVLGQGARDRGAECDKIPESQPGIGYVALEGVAEPVRVRFGHVTDTDLADLVHTYAPRPRLLTGGAA